MAVVRNTIKEQVYREIKSRILGREYPPGSFLNIVHLSREFQVSNSPIREALAMLEKEELVSLAANSKFKVTKLDEEKMQELNTAIVTLLSGAVLLCARKNKMQELKDGLTRALKAQEALETGMMPEQKYSLALDFDRTVVTATDNALLIKAFDGWYNLLYLSTSQLDDMPGVSLREHYRILEAVTEEDIPRILQELERHYDKHLVS